MRVFERETTDFVADQFRGYFTRKERGRMTFREAKTMIDFVSGPSAKPSGDGVIDYSKPRVSGGGAMRPTEEQVEGIVRKYEDTAAWDKVFDDLIRQCKDEPDAMKIIYMAFRDGKKESEICENIHMSKQLYYNYRLTILYRAAVIAVSYGIIKVQKVVE